MAGHPTFSVIIDTFNYEKYLYQAIESVICQDFPDNEREIIVVDDGSTDDTDMRIAKYGDKILRIRKPNGGQASALNCGVAAALGDIVCFLDADDYFYPNKLRAVYNEFSNNRQIGVVYNRYNVVDINGKFLTESFPLRLRHGDLSGRTLLGYISGSPTSGISVLRVHLENAIIPEQPFRISADYFLLNILPLITKVGVVDTPLHAYRKHGSNLYLKESPQSRHAIHSGQIAAIWEYTERQLGISSFQALHKLSEFRSDQTVQRRFREYLSGVKYLLKVRAPLAIKLWTFLKILALFLFHTKLFDHLRSLRDRIVPTKVRY